jgi:hypothetical protein
MVAAANCCGRQSNIAASPPIVISNAPITAEVALDNDAAKPISVGAAD